MRTMLTLALALLTGCAATTGTNAPATTQPQSEFKNLQVLPKNISRDELITIMKSFTRSLGVRCNECHVVTATEPKEEFDFPRTRRKTNTSRAR